MTQGVLYAAIVQPPLPIMQRFWLSTEEAEKMPGVVIITAKTSSQAEPTSWLRSVPYRRFGRHHPAKFFRMRRSIVTVMLSLAVVAHTHHQAFSCSSCSAVDMEYEQLRVSDTYSDAAEVDAIRIHEIITNIFCEQPVIWSRSEDAEEVRDLIRQSTAR